MNIARLSTLATTVNFLAALLSGSHFLILSLWVEGVFRLPQLPHIAFEKCLGTNIRLESLEISEICGYKLSQMLDNYDFEGIIKPKQTSFPKSPMFLHLKLLQC